MNNERKPTLGSLFAGIGGFDLGFERAGWRSAWHCEHNPYKRHCLAHRFPHSASFGCVRECGSHNLERVDCIAAGFPCKDISVAGNGAKRLGLDGPRSGLYWEALRIVRKLRPQWLVLENVPALLHSNGSRDFEAILQSLADSGYVGSWRVLDAAGFGVPARRERLYLVAGLGCRPPLEFLSDAAPVESIPTTLAEGQVARAAHSAPGYTLLAQGARSQITLCGTLLCAEQDGWHQMDERERGSQRDGFPLGLDDADLIAVHAAGDAVVPQVAEWIARTLLLQML